MRHSILLSAFAALALVFAGCTKQSMETAAAAAPKIYDLGVLEVSDGVAIRRDFDDGRTCTVNPVVQKDGTITLNLKIEAGGKVLSRPRIITKSDVGAGLTIGDIGIKVTPRIKT